MILELDLGNTYCKWRILGPAHAVLDRGFGERQQWLAGEFPESWRSHSIAQVKIASVLSALVESELDSHLSEHLDCPVNWARSTQSCAGLHNAYTEPARLGVDRWLAMIAAHKQLQRAVVVCDIGSALTLDIVDGQGAHRGGYIIPGPRLMANALLLSTDRVRFDDTELGALLGPGLSTGTCVGNGIGIASAGAVMIACRQAQSMTGGDVALSITGGYRELLVEHLIAMGLSDVHSSAELVLDGLRWAIP